MSTQCEVTAKKNQGVKMGFFERYLTLWVFLCIIAGIALGHGFPGPFQSLGRMEIAQVNMPVAVLIWLMIIPMLLKIDFSALHHVKEHWRGVGVTLFVNWAVKPFSMALLAWLFIRGLFADWLPGEQILTQPLVIGLLAVPILIQVYFNSGLANLLNRKFSVALATVVGVLIEVPVMLSVVKIVNNTKGWYEAGLAPNQ